MELTILLCTLLTTALACLDTLRDFGVISVHGTSELAAEIPAGPPSRRSRKMRFSALGLSLLSVALSSFAAYHFFKPRVVEKQVPVEKLVEKLVPEDCPQPKPVATHSVTSKPKDNPKKAVTPPITQDCGGGNCAASVGQQGGITAGQINYGAVDRHLSPQTEAALTVVAKSIPKDSIKTGYPVSFLTVQSAEAETFADEIAMVFYRQQIGEGRAIGGEYWNPQTPKGVIVLVKSLDDPAFPLAQKIEHAFTSTGVSAVAIAIDSIRNPGQVLIVTGEKTEGKAVAGTTSTLVVR